MRFYDILTTIAIFLIFFLIQFFNILSVGKKDIEKNWPKYRCNPMIMPFANFFGHDTQSNFTYCVQNMQSVYMKEMLKPVNNSINMSNMLSLNLGGSLQRIREVINQTRSFSSGIFQKIFGVFFNTLLEIQKITIKMKSIFAKMVGVGVSFFYIIDGTNMTGQSIWRGPVGGMLRTLCFHPSTVLHLENGTKKYMSEIKLDDVLENGSTVTGIVSLRNVTKEPFYEVFSKVYNEYIYVTGHHLIYDVENNRYIHVKDSKLAKETDKILDTFSCLITDDHQIQIGEHMFWDYEDDNILPITRKY